MKSSLPVLLVYVLSLPAITWTKPTETTTARSTPTIGETIKQLTHQLMGTNLTADVVLDTRTPPKIKQHIKKKESIENSHAGEAVPLDADTIILEESTKKMHFYKVEKPTTNSGLSTWILLSGQTQSPSTVVTKTTQNTPVNLTFVSTEAPNRIMKPVFKRRSTTTTTKKPTTTKLTTTTEAATKLNKVKASILTNAMKKKLVSTTERNVVVSTTAKTNKTTEPSKDALEKVGAQNLPLESKETELELTTNANDNKKTRRPAIKRKKNKNKRRRPASEKTSNSTKIAHKEKPIGTQFYNYLSREVMPTVGVGLVGLMVTAGLASYFLYPFGVARRSYEIDRKDKEGSYYYDNDSGGIAEEEAIGKVIAGMPTNYDDSYNNYRRYNQRNAYSSATYPQTKKQYEAPISYQTDSYQNVYDKDVIEQNKETGYMVADQRFYVGSVPEDVGYQEATPAAVPEHGPRSLRLRRAVEEMENDIFSDEVSSTEALPKEMSSTTSRALTTTSANVTEVATNDKGVSFFKLLGDLCRMKINLGLQLLQNATASVSRYLSKVQKRLDEHYRENMVGPYH